MNSLNEYELRVDCDASCSGTGALFCDNEYVLSAQDVPACVQALAARGIPAVHVSGSVSLSGSKVGGGCAMSTSETRGNGSLPALVAALALALRRRRRVCDRAAREM